MGVRTWCLKAGDNVHTSEYNKELLQKKLEGMLVELKFTTTLKLEILCSRSFLPHLWDWLGWTSPPSPLPSLNTKRKGSYSSQDVEGRGENAVFSAGSSPGHAQCASHPTRGVLAIDEVDRGNALPQLAAECSIQSEPTVPRFGLAPFRSMGTLDVRLRDDKQGTYKQWVTGSVPRPSYIGLSQLTTLLRSS